MYIVKRYIRIGDSEELYEVTRAFSFLNDTLDRPKMTMNIIAPRSSFTAEDIKNLFTQDNDIYLYEDSYKTVTNEDGAKEVIHTVPLRCVYKHYCKNLNFKYSSVTDTWDITMDKKEETEILAENNREDLITAHEAIADLYETKLALEK